jgi:hypothetical protein
MLQLSFSQDIPMNKDLTFPKEYRIMITMITDWRDYMTASGSRYVPISADEMVNLMDEMGFTQVYFDGTVEMVFERQVEGKSGRTYPYAVRVYTSVTRSGSRDCGEDAIRVVLVDLETNRPMKVMGEGKKGKAGRRIYRTKSALVNLKERCRDYFRHVMLHSCPKCGKVMAIREGRNGQFLGCTNYPECNGTKPMEKAA